MITVVDVTRKYLEYVVRNLRKDDKLEMTYEFGKNYSKELMNICLAPDIKIMLGKNNIPIGLYGIREISNGARVAEVCLLVTDEFKFYLKDFLSQGKEEIEKWRRKYDIIENLVYKHNKKAMRWLKILGFSLKEYDDKRMHLSLQGLRK